MAEQELEQDLFVDNPFKGKFALICGGSKGIGKATAELFVKLGGSVCIVARGIEALSETESMLKETASDDSQFVESFSCDTSDMDKLKPLIEDLISRRRLPDYLFNFVGFAITGYLEDLTFKDFKENMDLNYHGQLVPALIMLPHYMKAKQGYISFTSSVMGFFAIMGYATYIPTKYAIFGLAESLRHELLPYGIKVSVLFPTDTNTPAFERENITKPEECKIISDSGTILEASEVADVFLRGILKNDFEILTREAAIQINDMRSDPNQLRGVVDSLYKRARRKTKRKI